MLCLENAEFYGLNELKDDWRVCGAKIKKWLVSGKLQSSVWLPVMSVYSLKECVEGEIPSVRKELRHYEGFVPLSSHQCQRLYRNGELTMREFQSCCGKLRFQLPDSSDDIRASVDDLLVLLDEKHRFEREIVLPRADELAVEDAKGSELVDTDFRNVVVDGESHTFGTIQASVLHQLYLASKQGKGWLVGKRLLHDVGSESFSLSNVFKHKPIWKRLIESDGRGRYRLRRETLWDESDKGGPAVLEMGHSNLE